MATQRYRLAPGQKTEDLGQEILVCDTEHALVHRISGPTAEVLRRLLAGDGNPIELDDDELTRGLEEIGVIVSADAESGMLSRRRVIGAGAAVGTVGIATLVLPRAAAASSEVGPLDSTTTTTEATTTTSSTTTTTTIPPGPEGRFSVLVDNESPTPVELRWRRNSLDADSFTYTYRITSDSEGIDLSGGPLASDTLHVVIESIAKGITLSFSVTSSGGLTLTGSFLT